MSAPASEDERLSDGASYGTEQCDELDNRFAANRVQNNSGVNELVSVFRQGARRTSRTLVELQAKAASYARVVPRNLAVSNPPLPSSRMRDITLDDVACLEDMECLEELTRLAHGAAIAEIDAAVPRQVPAPGRIAIRHSQSAPGSRMASPRRQRRRTRSKELAPAVESAAREVGRASTPPPSGAKQAMQSPVSYTPVLQLQVGGVTQPDGRSSAPLPSNRPGSPFQPVETGAINAHNADSAASSVAGLAAESESCSGFFGECDARQVAWESLLQREYVGSGEFCEVWGAKLDGAAVAVKVLKEEHCGKELAVKDLESETQIMMRLRHPGCLRVLGVGSTDSGKPFLVLDRLKETLSTTLPKAPDQGSIFERRAAVKRWPLVRALQVGLELAEALRYCHDDAVPGFRLLVRAAPTHPPTISPAGRAPCSILLNPRCLSPCRRSTATSSRTISASRSTGSWCSLTLDWPSCGGSRRTSRGARGASSPARQAPRATWRPRWRRASRTAPRPRSTPSASSCGSSSRTSGPTPAST